MFSTSFKIALIILFAFLFRFLRVFKGGDEKIFNAYVYYIALPSFLLLELNRLPLKSETFVITAVIILSTMLSLLVYLVFRFFLRFSTKWFVILSLSTAFGSTAFFGIPFVSFAYPNPSSLQLTALVASVSGIVGLTTVLFLLELEKAKSSSIFKVFLALLKRLSKNPLIISILLGFFSNILRIEIKGFVFEALSMFAKSTAIMAIFMLGLYLYGRNYRIIAKGIFLSLPRILLLPAITFLIARFFGLAGDALKIVVLLQAMPVAITMITITQKYEFEEELFANVVMVSSLSALFYLNVIKLLLEALKV